MRKNLQILAITADSETLTMQYVIVASIIIGAILWICIKLFGKKRKPGGGCCGCALSEQCSPDRRKIVEAAARKGKKESCNGKKNGSEGLEKPCCRKDDNSTSERNQDL